MQPAGSPKWTAFVLLCSLPRSWWMSAVGYRGGVAPPCLRPAACLESGCRGEGGGGLDRLERGWVDAHAELGVDAECSVPLCSAPARKGTAKTDAAREPAAKDHDARFATEMFLKTPRPEREREGGRCRRDPAPGDAGGRAGWPPATWATPRWWG